MTVFALPSNCYTWKSPAFQRTAGGLPARETYSTNFLFGFACVHSFTSLTKLSLSQPMSFLVLVLLILSFIPLQGGWVNGWFGTYLPVAVTILHHAQQIETQLNLPSKLSSLFLLLRIKATSLRKAVKWEVAVECVSIQRSRQ